MLLALFVRRGLRGREQRAARAPPSPQPGPDPRRKDPTRPDPQPPRAGKEQRSPQHTHQDCKIAN
eukprot:10989127-Alexandrium_andersonii.AAC.1